MAVVRTPVPYVARWTGEEHLRGTGTVTVRVRYSEIDGVHGLLYRRLDGLAVPARNVTLSYGDPATAWTLAAHQTRALYGCTIVAEHPAVEGRRRP